MSDASPDTSRGDTPEPETFASAFPLCSAEQIDPPPPRCPGSVDPYGVRDRHDHTEYRDCLTNLSPKRAAVPFSLPGRLVSRSGIPTLRTPSEWPWADAFLRALDLLRGLPPVPLQRRVPRASHRRRWHWALTSSIHRLQAYLVTPRFPQSRQTNPGGPSRRRKDDQLIGSSQDGRWIEAKLRYRAA